MKVGDPYIPLQRCNVNEPFELKTDDDFIFKSRYGKYHVVVKDCVIVKYEKIEE